MRPVFLLLTGLALALLGLTAIVGWVAANALAGPGADALIAKHFLLGLLAALFTCLVHTVNFMYFAVCEKILREAAFAGQTEARYVRDTAALKSRSLRAAVAGILLLLGTIALGAAVGSGRTGLSVAHWVAGLVTLAAHAAIFAYQFTLIDKNRAIYRAAVA